MHARARARALHCGTLAVRARAWTQLLNACAADPSISGVNARARGGVLERPGAMHAPIRRPRSKFWCRTSLLLRAGPSRSLQSFVRRSSSDVLRKLFLFDCSLSSCKVSVKLSLESQRIRERPTVGFFFDRASALLSIISSIILFKKKNFKSTRIIIQ